MVRNFTRLQVMVPGFLAAAAGDWLLAVMGCHRGTAGFLGGVAAFSVAQLLWTAGNLREARPDGRAFVLLAFPLSLFVGVRLWPVLNPMECAALSLYALISSLNVATAWATRRLFYLGGASLLLVSDVMIGGRWLGVPGVSRLVGPVYLAAELSMLVSAFARSEPRRGTPRCSAAAVGIGTAALSGTCFALAAFHFPGGGYNPLTRMLSALGRTEVCSVRYPPSHFLFVAGMLAGAWGVLAIARRQDLSRWGAAFNVGGLLAIALVPETVSMPFHNAGCWLATAGGGLMLVRWFRQEPAMRTRLVWTVALLLPLLAIGSGLVLHGLHAVPFAPWVPTAQKGVILSFVLWLLFLSIRPAFAAVGRRLCILALVTGCAAVSRAGTTPPCEDERAGLRFLDFVSAPMSAADEKAWWDIGGRQFGLFSKRYHIAFSGYAAAAIGMRGTDGERRTVGKILDNCIKRILRRDAWAYSQSKKYWGAKPWAPDPCYRENVMYTGHLLQLLALYETFTHDTKYWTQGFDFVWSTNKVVHYDVQKLIDVTVGQMRTNGYCGVTCEPGLLFFPCNNHPQVAFKLFKKLGHGDWTADSRRWERWALDHYQSPLFGGGALNLVYHVPTGLFYPRGSSGLDAWSLLWYEPWAEKRETALGLWRKAARKLDWGKLDEASDARPGSGGCADPQPVPETVKAAFLAAAARACDDSATAERLERTLDAKYLVRTNGLYYLDLGRDWRIATTAQRILALAIANGSRFRDL